MKWLSNITIGVVLAALSACSPMPVMASMDHHINNYNDTIVATSTTELNPNCIPLSAIQLAFNSKGYTEWTMRKGAVYDAFYDPHSKLFFFFPKDKTGCLHMPVIVTQYHYSFFTETPYA